AIIEQQNRMPKGALLGGLTRAGIDSQLARDQIRADLTWLRVTGRVLQPQVKIGEEEINDRLETIKERQGRPEFLAAEIVLPVDNPSLEDDAHKLGERLVEQLKTGAPFAALARQFSRAPTASNGGSMGWLSEISLDEEIAGPLAQLNKGQITPLIRTSSGFSIILLVDRRIAGQVANPEDAQVTLSHMILPVPPRDAPPKQELLAKAAQLTANVRTCAGLEQTGRSLGSPNVGSLGTKRIGELDATLRRAVATLPVNRPSEPIDSVGGIQVVMVCDRQESTQIALPSREQIRRSIEDERMDMLSRRYIRNLRRSAFIETRS
ncbi:MAG: peptidylprolyl isomerase, partial [Magnetospirillum sp.]|nr:peptidylprolyl isomerase [Magnetospirillum sp.]